MSKSPIGDVENSLDELLAALSNDRRRRVLDALGLCEKSAVSIDTLVDEFIESDDRASRHRLRLELHHVHLPKLAASGFVEYDTDSGRVRPQLSEFERELLTTVTTAHQ